MRGTCDPISLLECQHMTDGRQIYTIGHGTLATEQFISNLRAHGVSVVIDVRSQPGSQWAPQFGRNELEASLAQAGIRYVWDGERLGGRPPNQYLTGTGAPDYESMSQRQEAQEALNELAIRAKTDQIALMCSESDPASCHRSRMVAPECEKRGLLVSHILANGSLLDAPSLFA